MIKKILSLVLILGASISATFSQTYVPDDNFEQALIDLGHDDVMDDYVVTENISSLTNLNVNSKNISSLVGIEDFTSLESLSVRQNNLSLLDVSTLSNLINLYCEESNIETLILSSNLTKLERLFCDSNSINDLNLTGLTSLIVLGCARNNIESLDFSTLTSLDVLSCGGNQITFLDLNNNPITILNCKGMESLSSIFLKNNTDLVYWDWTGIPGGPPVNTPAPGQIITDFSDCPNLQFICVDSGAEQTSIQDDIDLLGYTNCTVATECSKVYVPNLVPDFFTIGCIDPDTPGIGWAYFDLTSLNSGIIDQHTSTNVTISYHLTEQEANNNVNAIVNQNNYYSQSSYLYIRSANEEENIYTITRLRLNLNESIFDQLYLGSCDDIDGVEDGYSIFNLELIYKHFSREGEFELSAILDNVTLFSDGNRTVEITDLNYVNTIADNQIIYGSGYNYYNCLSYFEVELNVVDSSDGVVCIPDATFKDLLINSICVDSNGDDILDTDVDTNDDGEIQISEALNVSVLKFNPTNQTNVSNLIGIENFSNLTKLDFGGVNFNTYDILSLSKINIQPLTKLEYLEIRNVSSDLVNNFDLSNLSNLVELILIGWRGYLDCSSLPCISFDSSRANINLEGCSNLEILKISNSFLNIDYCQIPQLKELDCHYLEGGEPEIFDLSCLSNLETVDLSENYFDVVILKNGAVIPNLTYIDIGGQIQYPNFICIDDIEEEKTQIAEWVNGGITIVNSYCSFTPGGNYYTVQGTNRIDSNFDDCDINDPVFPNLKFNLSDGTINGDFIFDATGNYQIPLQEGVHTITPIVENPDYYTISPTFIEIEYSTDTSPFIQDFCITPIPGLNDLEVSIIPLSQARPGFNCNYKIIYRNKGSVPLNGTVNFNFDGDTLDFISSSIVADSQSTNSLTWNLTNLTPLENREVNVYLNLNSPVESPPVNNGDILTFVATVSPTLDDQTPNDNIFTLNQTVVGSYDPNDKTCLEGTTITPDLIGEYVHYLIRCENTGTSEAVNIVIKDEIDITKFDISSLIITDSSHSMITEINDNTVEFIFKNINLPFDDANNDGYVAFKIKTLPTLQVNDEFENDAEIYFDYNAAIITNTAKTSVKNALGTYDYKQLTGEFKMYPNPVENTVFIESKENIKSISIYNNFGKLIQQVSIIGIKNQVSILTQNLVSGIYFVKVETTLGIGYRKLIKK